MSREIGDPGWALSRHGAIPSGMTSPQRAQAPESNRPDGDANDVAARSGRFKVRIDAFGRIIPEVLPVDGEDESAANR
jgi:hypothetical protein